jgi:DUF1680 family protein
MLSTRRARAAAKPPKAEPFPLNKVRLLPSPYLTAVQANLAYLHRLEPDRLLHNFRQQAGLPPKGETYGGWEADTIAGHTLGHYMTALALMHAQTGDPESARRLRTIVAELAECQAQSTDGFVAGFTRIRDGKTEPGRLVFDEVRRGDIRVRPFNLNGCWVPLYNWHKLLGGLLAADRHCSISDAIPVAERLGVYIEGVFDSLNDAQIQQMLDCEHGGINESFAELYARTGRKRWLALSEKIYHRRILEPLSRGEDCLSTIHANTQIPKIIGLARLYELTGEDRHRRTADFFWNRVTSDYSYVIGGNADQEYFEGPRAISKYITEQTCESCNSYNMLKLTRHLYADGPDAHYFDYYERTHLNHILAQQNPATGMFAYMVPLMSGSHRDFSSPFDDFWCCVGTGMESHAKHGDSIYWRAGDALMVNLYIPSILHNDRGGWGVRMETDYPFSDDITLRITHAKTRPAVIALRVPGWCSDPAVAVNGEKQHIAPEDSYLRLRRAWKSDDVISLTLPRRLWIEPTPDDPDMVALLFGPLVLAGDLGSADQRWTGLPPVLIGADPLMGIKPTSEPAVFRTEGVVRPGDLTLRPFAFQHERNTAVYFQRTTETAWAAAQDALHAEQAKAQSLAQRAADVLYPGETQSEQDHQLDADLSYSVVYRGRQGRDARSGGFFEFTLKTKPGPLVLSATYWGEERHRRFTIFVNGVAVAKETLDAEKPGMFFERDYPLPLDLTRDKDKIKVRIEPETGVYAGPIYGIRLFGAGET